MSLTLLYGYFINVGGGEGVCRLPLSPSLCLSLPPSASPFVLQGVDVTVGSSGGEATQARWSLIV